MRMTNKYFTFLFLCLIIDSCSDVTKPIPENFDNIFMGSIGTERKYQEVEYWYNIDSNKPYFQIPDSLRNRITLNSHLLNNAAVIVNNFTETVDSLNSYEYSYLELEKPRNRYVETESFGDNYNLADALDSLENNSLYQRKLMFFTYNIYEITNNGFSIVYPKYFQSTLFSFDIVKNDMSVGDNWTNYQHFDTLNNTLFSEEISEVISKEKLSLRAGNFNAFKIKITENVYENNHTPIVTYEYYAPYVGLVLKEYEGIIKWRNIKIYRKYRKELNSYSFVK